MRDGYATTTALHLAARYFHAHFRDRVDGDRTIRPQALDGAMFYQLYRGLTTLAGPLVPVLLDRRQAADKEDPGRRGERLGVPSHPRPPGRLAWLHAASVGEALSVQVLVGRLLAHDADLRILLTTGTVTSARLIGGRLPARAVHQYIPVDRMAYVRRFLDHWRPDLVLWVESELWPNLLTEIARRGIPAAMVNARLSARTFARWRRLPGMIRTLLATFATVLPWDDESAARFRALGAAPIGPVGNLKFSADPLAADAAALAPLRGAVGDRPVWLAASTHDGEEALCAAAHQALAPALPGLLTVIVPRHPARGPAIADMATTRGLAAARRGAGALPAADTAVYVADTMGEMGTLLRLAPIVFVGGSLVPHGGHNPVEPVQLDSAVLYGPHMTNFSEITAQLAAADAALQVADGDGLTAALRRLFTDPAERDRLAAAAAAVAARNRGVVDAVMATLRPLLPPARTGEAA